MMIDAEFAAHNGAANVLRRAAEHEIARIVAREGGAPYPYVRQRMAAQNALLRLGWDSTAALVASSEADRMLDEITHGLALSSTRDTNSPAYRDRARAAMIEVAALNLLAKAQPRGRFYARSAEDDRPDEMGPDEDVEGALREVRRR